MMEDDMDRRQDVLRLPLALVVIFFIGKLALGFAGVSYETGVRIFSMVTLEVYLAVLWGGVVRRYEGYRPMGAVTIGIMIAAFAQVLIVAGTALSYVVGDTHFNDPAALNVDGAVGFGTAMIIRVQGLIGNCVLGGVGALVGYGLDALVSPKTSEGQSRREGPVG
jgi:hypothetical protein